MAGGDPRDSLYETACADFAPALARLARSAESDADRARDLEQDIHLALWRSLAGFDGRCALGTWVYRVAHNVAASHIARDRRAARLIGLDEVDDPIAPDDPAAEAEASQILARLHALIARLKPADRSVILLYLEGMDGAGIAEVTGLSATNVGVKIHRIKALLARRFDMGAAA